MALQLFFHSTKHASDQIALTTASTSRRVAHGVSWHTVSPGCFDAQDVTFGEPSETFTSGSGPKAKMRQFGPNAGFSGGSADFPSVQFTHPRVNRDRQNASTAPGFGLRRAESDPTMIGWKATVSGRADAGFCEIQAYSADRQRATVRYYVGPSNFVTSEVNVKEIDRSKVVPAQSRCVVEEDGGVLVGRILTAIEANGDEYRSYWVRLPNQPVRQFREDAFHVISYCGQSDPLATLARLGQETPFFAEKRRPLMQDVIRHESLCHGLIGLTAARIELFPHQVEVARRVLCDPVMRYLLADEVGLGKTIEAGVVLKQLRTDLPALKAVVFVPSVLKTQWEQELTDKFELDDVPVMSHGELIAAGSLDFDIAVVDEVHRLVGTSAAHPGAYSSLCRLAHNTPHLLLLSATPVLYRDADLLALLHVLDPQNYDMENIKAFRRLLALRQDVGRSLLALENVKLPPLIRNQLTRVATLLPQDPTVQELVSHARGGLEASSADASTETVKRLRTHIANTYCIHRRMVRTRRKYLMEELGIGASRVEQTVEFEFDEDWHRRLWELLEEWRIEAASRASREGIKNLGDVYIELAEAIALDPDLLAKLIERCIRHNRTICGRSILERILRELPKREEADDRGSLTVQVIQLIHRREGPGSKRIVFCSDPGVARSLGAVLATALGESSAEVICGDGSVEECEERLDHFRSDAACSVLVCDSTLEEGRNLQFADGLILYDIPWAPMQLEQRIGRLDRIDRVDPVKIKTILSLDDDQLALDAAWYRVLKDGFGIFAGSLSDLQLVIDSELPRLKQTAFEGGAAALCDAIPALRGRIDEERRRLEEQDVIDGLRLDQVQNTTLWRDVQVAEHESDKLLDDLEEYLRSSLRLWTRRVEEGKSLVYSIMEDQDPVIPYDRVLPLALYARRELTWWRPRAVRESDVELLRVGHPLLQSLSRLLLWDERGRAYALWRHTPGLAELQLIFRLLVVVETEINSVEQRVAGMRLDQTARGSLSRLFRGWFVSRCVEVFVHPNGISADERLVEHCRRPYDKTFDVNLGGERATAVERCAGGNWPAVCAEAARNGLAGVVNSDALKNDIASARRTAAAHFHQLEDRLRVRSRAGVDSAKSLDAAASEIRALGEVVDQAISQPRVRIDTIGAYFLSEDPLWRQ